MSVRTLIQSFNQRGEHQGVSGRCKVWSKVIQGAQEETMLKAPLTIISFII